jgi:tetraacyldisaccharide 4'-kinase
MISCNRYFRQLWEGKRRTFPDALLVAFLTPFSVLYGFVMEKRAANYHSGKFVTHRLAVPVVSVGNLSVGGTGKTPMVSLLASVLIARGKRVAVLSRGYGGSGKGAIRIVSDGSNILLSPEESGDEPYLLAGSVPGLIVVTGADRYLAGLEALERFQPDVFILDDGFQHLRLHRDLNILLLDAGNPFGNGRTLPAGLLRENRSAVRRADLVIYTRCDDSMDLPVIHDIPACRSIHRLTGMVPLAGGAQDSFDVLKGRKGIGFAGIAAPEGFFSALRQQGLDIVDTHAFRDHCDYTGGEITLLLRAMKDSGADYLITTEKDAVKLSSCSEILAESYVAVLKMELPEPSLMERELDKIL